MRMGKKKQPTYRVVAADQRSPRDGRFIEIVGIYNPRTEPSQITIDNAKAVGWLRNGAQPSDRVRKLLEISGAWQAFKSGVTAEELEAEQQEAKRAAEEAASGATPEPAVSGAGA
jgi:small subunit ribosomal protein S16